MKRAFIWPLALWLLASTAQGHSAARHAVRLVEFDPPQPVPTFTLTGLDGSAVDLARYRGKFVLLNFWATWCPPCVKEMPSMERLADRLQGKPFAVLAVSLDKDGAATVAAFVERLEVTFAIALDPQAKVATAYGANELPTTFLLDPRGQVIAAAKGERDWASQGILDYVLEQMDGGTTN